MTALTELATPSVERIGMSIEEFWRRQDEQPFELIDGEIIPLMTPKIFASDLYAKQIETALEQFTIPNQLGTVFVETTFILPDTSDRNWVKGSRQPDVLFLEKARLEDYRKNTPDWKQRALMLIPDLAIEIVSPTDRMPKVWRKAAVYLEDGVRLVWVINPMRNTVTVFAGDESPITLDATQTLLGGDVLPGFSLSLAQFFAD